MPLSQDAALVVAFAGTAIPFAHSAEDEAERWLRALRLHGKVGKLMQALGVGESALPDAEGPKGATQDSPPHGEAVLEKVTRRAARHAAKRHSETVDTSDLLLSVMDVYGPLFDQLLYVRGTSGDELVEHLDDPHPARSPSNG